MSNNSEYWRFAASVVHDRSQINSLRNMHEPPHPTEYSHGFISYQAPYNANARRVQFDEIEFIIMYIIILSAHTDKLNEFQNNSTNRLVFTWITRRYFDYWFKKGDTILEEYICQFFSYIYTIYICTIVVQNIDINFSQSIKNKGLYIA